MGVKLIGLQELDMVLHRRRIKYVVNQHQSADDVAYRGVLRGVDDACVSYALRMKAQKVFVL